MGKLLMKKLSTFFLVLMLAATMGVLVGCEGDDGATGAQGPQGPTGPAGPAGPPGSAVADLSTLTPEQQADLGVVSIPTGSISVTITSPPVVNFALEDALGRPVLGLDEIVAGGNANVIRFTLARLVPGNPDSWSSYLVAAGEGSYDSPNTGGTLVSNGDGTYTYTWNYDVGADASFDPTATHRLAGQIGGGGVGFEPSNFFFDFVPDGSAVTDSRFVALTESCNECHDPLNIHGRRRIVEFCVTCHTSELAEGEGEMSFMVHKIHAAGTFAVLDNAISYAEVTYPQDLRNCRKCHNGNDAGTPDGNNWQTVQDAKTCFTSCHEVADIAIPGFHSPTTGNCSFCHDGGIAAVLDIAAIHVTPNATENNPELLPGQRNIVYEVDSAAIAAGELTITFRILSDGTPMDLTVLPADLTGGPSFLFAYAMGPQDGLATTVDFNNLGNSAGQPASASLATLRTGGMIACDANNTCTATMADPFPVGAAMRTVGLQGYFTQTGVASLHTQSAVVTVTGDTARRAVADTVGCSDCHEIFEGHGGNRVFTANGGIQICTLCHNPNLSSSGRAIEPADAVGSNAALALGNTDTLTWPEATNNFKDMIHGIHASAFRTTEYEFVRNRLNGIYYNWSEVTFPGDLSNCVKCHLGNTYLPDEVPVAVLTTTNRTTGVADGMDATQADVRAARGSVPNDTDWIISPITAACYACHDSLAAMGHMEQFGGAINWNRIDFITENPIETCGVCHGEGNIADVEPAHGL